MKASPTRDHATAANGGDEGLEVAIGLVGIGLRKSRERAVERVGVAEVGADRNRIARARMRTGERPLHMWAYTDSPRSSIAPMSAEAFQSQSWRT